METGFWPSPVRILIFLRCLFYEGSPAAKGNTGGFWMWDGHLRMPNVSSTGPMFGIFRSVMKFKCVGLV